MLDGHSRVDFLSISWQPEVIISAPFFQQTFAHLVLADNFGMTYLTSHSLFIFLYLAICEFLGRPPVVLEDRLAIGAEIMDL